MHKMHNSLRFNIMGEPWIIGVRSMRRLGNKGGKKKVYRKSRWLLLY